MPSKSLKTKSLKRRVGGLPIAPSPSMKRSQSQCPLPRIAPVCLIVVALLLWCMWTLQLGLQHHHHEQYISTRPLSSSSTEWTTSSSSSKNANPSAATLQFIDDLQYRNAMLTARSTGTIYGPFPLSSLPKSQQERFARFNMTPDFDPDGVWSDGTGGKSGIYQAPTMISERKLMNYVDGSWEKKWSKELIDALVKAVQDGEDISPRSYPGCALQIQQALEDHVLPTMKKQKKYYAKQNAKQNNSTQQHGVESSSSSSYPRILVGGSISPWVESIILAVTGVPKVWVVDWQPIEILDDRIECLLMPDLTRQRPDELFDIVVSYSSIEHDGLGRYGDPIHPDGDLAAMAEYYTLLKTTRMTTPGQQHQNNNESVDHDEDDVPGLLLLGIPKVEKGTIFQSNHRMFGPQRIEALTQGFDVLDEIRHNTAELAKRFNKDRESVRIKLGWQRQPVFVLRKRSDRLPLLLS